MAAEPVPGGALPTHDLRRRIELAVWRILIDEVIVKGRHSDTPALMARVLRSDALLPWQGILLRTLGEKKTENKENLLFDTKCIIDSCRLEDQESSKLRTSLSAFGLFCRNVDKKLEKRTKDL